MDLYGAIHYIRKIVGYENYLKEITFENNRSMEETLEILNFIHDSTKNMDNLDAWKEHIKLFEENMKNAKEEQEGVHILTMHACKGLEYPIVFLPDCNEGKVPHKKATTIDAIIIKHQILDIRFILPYI
jgi:DNA helicase-2/ATP-dependent DNA helicase PcrA